MRHRLIHFFCLLVLAGAWIANIADATAQTFPELTGRVVDDAGLLAPETQAALTARLESLEQQTGRQLVIATIADLQGYPIEDYGYQLGRKWAIGQKDRNDGVLLIVAPSERKVRIEVGYGLEPVITDALAALIVRRAILPAFREGDMSRGIVQGADAIIAQLQLSPEEAAARNQHAAALVSDNRKAGAGAVGVFWIVVIVIVLLVFFTGGRGGGGGGRRFRGGKAPVVIWGPGPGSFGGGGGWSGGGFSGGGGSFGGGGASGGW